jgi:hypothetical protein
MKKAFTLLMIGLVATSGFAQIKGVSKSQATKKVAQEQIITGRESMENVANIPAMTRTDGELDYTTYDWQSNDGARTWTIMWEDGKINFAYTYASSTDFSDRGTAIGTYNAANDEWIPGGSRVENEKTGFGSIARYGENGIVVAAHTASQLGVYIIEDKDNLPSGSVEAVSYLPSEYDACWANVMTSGANRDIIHIVCTANGATINGATDPVIYFRSQDGGLTWDKQDVILPYMTEEYAIDWTSNCCHWMETTEDNRLALVVNNAWSDGMVLYSDDNGETWERKVFYSHPNPFGDFTDKWFFYPRWTSCQWDNAGKLHVAYEFNGSTGTPGSGSYYPALGGVAYWSEIMPYNENGTIFTPGEPFVMDSNYMFTDIYASLWMWSDATHEMWPEYVGYLTPLTPEGNPEDPYTATEFAIEDNGLHGAYNSGICAMPVLCMDPASNDMVIIWSAMDENNTDGTNFYYKLFARYSGDGGNSWSDMVQLTTDFIYSLSEYVYAQAVVRDGQLIIAVQSDPETGTFVQSDDGDGSNNYYQGFTFDINELFGWTWNVNEANTDTQMNVYPSPATDKISVVLSNNQEIVVFNLMGQVIATYEGHAGINTLDITSLRTGVYFISAGNETQKFIVK